MNADLITGTSESWSRAGHTITHKFQVLTTPEQASPRTATGLPVYGSQHPVYSGLYVTEINPRQPEDQNGLRWEVDVVFSPATPPDEGIILENQSITPWFQNQQRTKNYFPKGPAVVQSAVGTPYDSPPNIQTAGELLTLVRRETTLPADILDYNNSVNSAAVVVMGTEYEPWTLRLSLGYQESMDSGYPHRYTYSIYHRYNLYTDPYESFFSGQHNYGWHELTAEFSNQYLVWEGSGEDRTSKTFSFGQQTSGDQQNLILSGPQKILGRFQAQAATTEPGTKINPAAYPYIQMWNPYKAINWEPLKLEIGWAQD
jgi:hypothetical protein